jgi:hypothetical protein
MERVLAVFAAALVLAAGCTETNYGPIIDKVEGSRNISAGDSVDFLCDASDPEGQPLDFAWSASDGLLLWDWGNTVRWVTPDSADTVRMSVTVTDDQGVSVEDSFEVIVRPDTVGLFFWDGAVKAGYYVSWPDTIKAGYKLYGYCGSDTGEIFLLVMDDTNYTRWRVGEPSVALLQRMPYLKDTFSLRITATGLYYIVMDNRQGAEDYDYWLWVRKAGP